MEIKGHLSWAVALSLVSLVLGSRIHKRGAIEPKRSQGYTNPKSVQVPLLDVGKSIKIDLESEGSSPHGKHVDNHPSRTASIYHQIPFRVSVPQSPIHHGASVTHHGRPQVYGNYGGYNSGAPGSRPSFPSGFDSSQAGSGYVTGGDDHYATSDFGGSSISINHGPSSLISQGSNPSLIHSYQQQGSGSSPSGEGASASGGPVATSYSTGYFTNHGVNAGGFEGPSSGNQYGASASSYASASGEHYPGLGQSGSNPPISWDPAHWLSL